MSHECYWKVYHKKSFNVGPLELALNNIWENPVGLKIVQLDAQTVQTFFDAEVDLLRAIQGGPWVYRNSWQLIVVEDLINKTEDTLLNQQDSNKGIESNSTKKVESDYLHDKLRSSTVKDNLVDANVMLLVDNPVSKSQEHKQVQSTIMDMDSPIPTHTEVSDERNLQMHMQVQNAMMDNPTSTQTEVPVECLNAHCVNDTHEKQAVSTVTKVRTWKIIIRENKENVQHGQPINPLKRQRGVLEELVNLNELPAENSLTKRVSVIFYRNMWLDSFWESLVGSLLVKTHGSGSSPQMGLYGEIRVQGVQKELSIKPIILRSSMQHTEAWKKIWKSSLPGKIKHFVWREIKEILSVCDRLRPKGLDVSPICPVCNAKDETTHHALLGCPSLSALWRRSTIPFVEEFDTIVPFADWFDCALTQWNSNQLCIFAITCYKLWNQRNEIHLNLTSAIVDQIWYQIRELWLEISSLSRTTIINSVTPPVAPKWSRPPFLWLKLNVYACSRNGWNAGVGCMIQNEWDRVLATATFRLPDVVTVEELEDEGVLLGLEMARDLSISKLVVEGDCKWVFDKLKTRQSSCAPVGLLFDSIKSLAFQFSHICFE
ncbi:uncharacterized protein G2W53_028558 [Senna tora]|uniref:Reverse transcriptase zinc-binding domain-containing protein n=1 Tax=Senna tora TaxID=362788 RepID=A0A834TCJ3_9FABA|nr:uncharacterized protein G2W53_028558 [Senna tora]